MNAGNNGYEEVLPHINRPTLEKYHVQMKHEVSFTWDANTPPEVRENLMVFAAALQQKAEEELQRQLDWMGIRPTGIKEVTHGETEEGGVVLREGDWHPPVLHRD